ncbi:MAG TPA: hypothetical protein VLF21_00945 [Candidatus Saccharimonadales bacterium]|nr:hypothetical protein [Candidatus Saccharimonadales bacterium]
MNIFKKAMLAVASTAMAIAPFKVLADPQVAIESFTGVANYTNGDTSYKSSVNAKVDDVVVLYLWYHNKEEATSGKVANNLTLKANIPTAPGQTQTITTQVNGSNTNTVTNSANVNLSLASAYLEPIAGTTVWKHNVGTNDAPNWREDVLSQDQQNQLLSGGLNLGDEQPCFNFEASVTVRARVKASALSIVKQVKVDGSQDKFATEDTAKAGETLDYVLTIKNEGNTQLTQVQVADGLPPYLTYVPGSTKLVNSLTGKAGKMLSDDRLTTGGVTIDNMDPGSTQYVYLKATIDPKLPEGTHHLRNSASVRAAGTNQIFNVAFTNVNVSKPVCVDQPGKPCNPKPPVTPPTSSNLPETGPESAAAGLFGTSAIGYAAYTYRRSKIALANKLKEVK